MRISVTTSNKPADGVTLVLDGRFDAYTTADFQSIFDQTLEGGNVTMACDLSGVDFIDSSALAQLIRGMKRCREAGGDLILAPVSPPVRTILELTKLDQAFRLG